ATTTGARRSGVNIEYIRTAPCRSTLTLSGENIAAIKRVTNDLKETITGETSTVVVTSAQTEIALKKRSYTITANGTVELTTGEEIEAAGNAVLDLTQDNQNVNISLDIKSFSEDFIIEEVFFTGVQTFEGKNYNSGKYFKLTNNTDKTLNT